MSDNLLPKDPFPPHVKDAFLAYITSVNPYEQSEDVKLEGVGADKKAIATNPKI
jgi:hypothetical protein